MGLPLQADTGPQGGGWGRGWNLPHLPDTRPVVTWLIPLSGPHNKTLKCMLSVLTFSNEKMRLRESAGQNKGRRHHGHFHPRFEL